MYYEHPLKGRMGRRNFILAQLLIAGTVVILALVVMSNGFGYRMFNQLMLILLLSTIPQILFTVRRLHDLDMSGWWFLLMFIPYINFAFFLYLSVKKGDTQSNQYGHVDTRPLFASILNRTQETY